MERDNENTISENDSLIDKKVLQLYRVRGMTVSDITVTSLLHSEPHRTSLWLPFCIVNHATP